MKKRKKGKKERVLLISTISQQFLYGLVKVSSPLHHNDSNNKRIKNIMSCSAHWSINLKFI